MPKHKDFVLENVDPAITDSVVDNVSELLDIVLESVVKKIVANESIDAVSFRKSYEGKLAFQKYAKSNGLTESEDEDFTSVLTAEEVAAIDELIDSYIADLSEAVNDDDEIDPETGEKSDDDDDLDELQVKHMTAKEKLDSKMYRKSAAGKKAIKKFIKKTQKASYKADPTLSRTMQKVAKLRREDEQEDETMGLSEEELAALDAFIVSILESAEDINEAVEKTYLVQLGNPQSSRSVKIKAKSKAAAIAQAEEMKKPGESVNKYVQLVKESDDEEDPEYEEDSDYDEEDPEYEKDSDDDEVDEAGIKHMTAKEKLMAKMYRKSAAGKKALKKYAKKVSRAGYKVDKALSRKMSKVAKLRRESIEEQLTEAMKDMEVFGTLNESESATIKTLFTESVVKFLDESETKIVSALTEEFEGYVSSEVIPSIVDTFDTVYVPEIVESLNKNVEKYLQFVAEDIASTLSDKNLIVKSEKSLQLEDFTSELLGMIKTKLQIIPEQEDAMLVLKSRVDQLKDQLDESIVEKVKLKNALDESKKEQFLLSGILSDLSEAKKEKFLEYVHDELFEMDYSDFTEKVKIELKTASTVVDTKIEEDTKTIKNPIVDNMDLASRTRRLG